MGKFRQCLTELSARNTIGRVLQFNVFILFLGKNIFYGCSLEAPLQGASNEYPQHVFAEK